ncbi:hypothetical protein [Bosea sp. BIWAKO-01]|uniref:hypothetical protein n=1 Tax=Bosea sp. BIWAKO-01 TaxID=506668 RepID=UPI000852E9A0|nr:hypothetical protein [Bosea sp. BIWAKO-01]GAU84153.1 hypothetical protein BIWAKO_04085 [Bosea sp. BIWAKO-01]
MTFTIDPHDPEGPPSLLGTTHALEAAVIILLGYVSAIGADTEGEANANLAELRAHCQQLRETLLSMVAHREGLVADDLDDSFTRELDRIFEALSFRVNKPQ